MNQSTLVIEATRDGNRLKIGIHLQGETAWTYHQLTTPMDDIKHKSDIIFKTLNDISRHGGQNDPIEKLLAYGRNLSDKLFPQEVKNRIRQSHATYLIVNIDDHLVHIPWELISVGDEFLCQTFCMGRMVRTRQTVARCADRNLTFPLTMWVIANPSGDLENASEEGLNICDLLDRLNTETTVIDATLVGELTPDDMSYALKSWDMVHFAGHAEFNDNRPESSGWKLTQDIFTARDIDQLAGGAAMPSLVFSNACQSARTHEWDTPHDHGHSFGLANAFILSGTRHYVGTVWEISDSSGSQFALEFYQALLSGLSIGASIRQARNKLIADGNSACALSYILYGDPSEQYIPETIPHEKRQKTLDSSDTHVTTRSFVKGLLNRHTVSAYSLLLSILLLVIIGISAYVFHLTHNHSPSLSPDILNVLKELANEKETKINRSFEKLEAMVSENQKPTKTPRDQWTSKPITIAMDFDSDRCFIKGGKESLVSSIISKHLIEQSRAIMLERIHFQHIVDELIIANSKLVAHDTRMLPQIIPARFILFLEVDFSESRDIVLLHLSETTKRRNLKYFIAPLAKKSVLSQQDEMVHELLTFIHNTFPLRGIVSHTTDNQIQLNIGHQEGVRPGQTFQVKDQQIFMTVRRVYDHTSIVESSQTIRDGWRVELRSSDYDKQ
jgi:hypothetical protein